MVKKLKELVCAYARDHHDETLDLLRVLARIPAPTGHEDCRAEFVSDWWRAAGATQVEVDEARNVICHLGDDGACDLVVFAAHTDVVFDDKDELPLVERDGRLFAPGVGDDTANLVVLLIAARYLLERPKFLPAGTGFLVVANSCEEGLGNLAGTRRLFDAYGNRIKRFYSLDLYLPQCISEAVGSHRWKMEVRTQGGHSFHDFGRPNAIAELAGLVSDLYALDLAYDAPCTVNVGTICGGSTVNAIAAQAEALFEYRSTSDAVLRDMQRRVKDMVSARRREGVEVRLEEVGLRPANGPVDAARLAAMTEVTCDIIRSITGEEPDRSPASTDANIPLSRGVPANTIGAVRGGLLHTRNEWVDGASLEDGLAVALALMCSQGVLP